MAGFRMTIDGQWVVMAENPLRMERFNPVLEPGEIKGAKIMNFTIPSNAINDKVMKWRSLAQVPLKRLNHTAEMMGEDGSVIDKGNIKLLDVSENGFEMAYTSGFGEVFGEYAAVLLNALPLGAEPVPAVWSPAVNVGFSNYCLPTIQNPAIYKNRNHSGRMNNYVSGAYTTGPKVPMLFFHKVLEMITDLTGVHFTGDFMDDPIMKRLFIFNTYSLDTKDGGNLTEITYARHLPEVTINDMLKELAKLFNLALWINPFKKTIRIDYADAFFEKEVTTDWTRRVSKLITRQPANENRLKLDWELDKNDGLMKEIPEGFTSYLAEPIPDWQGEIHEVKSKWSGLQMEDGLPKVSMEIISPHDEQEGRAFGMRLGFWQGVVDNLPMASDSYGNVKLKLGTTPNELPARFWKNREKFLVKTYKVPVSIYLNSYELNLLDMHRHAGKNMCVHVQGNNYILGNQVLNTKTGRLDVELWRL